MNSNVTIQQQLCLPFDDDSAPLSSLSERIALLLTEMQLETILGWPLPPERRARFEQQLRQTRAAQAGIRDGGHAA